MVDVKILRHANWPKWQPTPYSQQAQVTCPRCGMTSYNLNDIREGYCGNCHDWTGTPQ